MRAHPHRLTPLVLGVALAAALAAPVAAQDESPEPEGSFPPANCDILTVDEASAALGEALTLVGGTSSDCQFDADYESMRFMSLFTSISEGATRDEMVGFLCSAPASPEAGATAAPPCYTEVPVGTTMGTYFPDSFGSMLYIDLGDGNLLVMQLVGDPVEGVDKLTALTALGELAVPRIAGLPAETTGPSEPSIPPDTDLEALFPSTIGDISLTIESQRGSEALADSEIPQSVLDALATQGKTLDDMSIASGSAFDPDTNTLVFIYAIKVAGADMTALADDFLAVFNDEAPPAEQTPSQVGGKDVIVVRPTADSTDDQLQYIYPKDDVLWVVSAVEPALSEALSKLP